jgi:hypothetical protein
MELKELVQATTPRDWRCHRRKVFFKRIFKGKLSIQDYHDLAGDISYHPFDQKITFDIDHNTNITISRITPIWILLFGFGKFDVKINDTNFQKWVWLW